MKDNKISMHPAWCEHTTPRVMASIRHTLSKELVCGPELLDRLTSALFPEVLAIMCGHGDEIADEYKKIIKVYTK